MTLERIATLRPSRDSTLILRGRRRTGWANAENELADDDGDAEHRLADGQQRHGVAACRRP
jgi:hypothetical protein